MKKHGRICAVPLLMLLSALAPISQGGEPATRPAKEPFEKTGLVLWLTAADAVVRDGSVVRLVDRSGQGHDAKRDTGARNVPANPAVITSGSGKPPVLRFDGTCVSFTFDRISDIRTVFWVVSKNPVAFKKKQELFVLGDSKSLDFHPGTHFTDRILNSGPYGSRYLREGRAWLNGKPVNGCTTDFPDRLGIITLAATGNLEANQLAKDRGFPDRCWNGDIAEILLFNTPLPDEQRQAVEAYLAHKYEIGTDAQDK